MLRFRAGLFSFADEATLFIYEQHWMNVAIVHDRCDNRSMAADLASAPKMAESRQILGGYRAWQLAHDPDGLIDFVWHSISSPVSPEPHRLLPFHEPSLLIRRIGKPGGDIAAVDLLVSSARPDSGFYHPVPGEELIAIALKPEQSWRIGLCPRDYRNCDPIFAPLGLQSALARVLRASERRRPKEVARDLFAAACSLARDGHYEPVARAAAIIRKRSGRVSCEGLASHLGLSARHLRRCFADRFGQSPRAFARRSRLTAAILHAERTPGQGWADIAAAHGYADQSHLIRDCRDIMGTSPAALRAERAALSAFFNTGAR